MYKNPGRDMIPVCIYLYSCVSQIDFTALQENRNMKLLNIAHLSNGVYELEKDWSDQQLFEGEYVKMLFGSISATLNPQARNEGDEAS